jgi:hypothetical protein
LNEFRRDGEGDARHNPERSSVSTPRYVSWISSIGKIESYIGIHSSRARLFASFYESTYSVLNASHDLWTHDVSVGVLAGDVTLLLTMLVMVQGCSFDSFLKKTYIALLKRREHRPGSNEQPDSV